MEKYLHQFWVGPFAIPEREKGFISDIAKGHSTLKHILWYDKNLPAFPVEVQRIFDTSYKHNNFNVCVDLLKIFILYTHGGIAMDADYKMHKSLDGSPILESRGFFLHDYGDIGKNISPCFVAAEKGDQLMAFMLEQAYHQQYNEHCWFGPDWYGPTIRKYFGLHQHAGHDELRPLMEQKGYIYLNPSIRDQHFVHHGLGSWTPEYVPLRRLRDTEHPFPELVQ